MWEATSLWLVTLFWECLWSGPRWNLSPKPLWIPSSCSKSRRLWPDNHLPCSWLQFLYPKPNSFTKACLCWPKRSACKQLCLLWTSWMSPCGLWPLQFSSGLDFSWPLCTWDIRLRSSCSCWCGLGRADWRSESCTSWGSLICCSCSWRIQGCRILHFRSLRISRYFLFLAKYTQIYIIWAIYFQLCQNKAPLPRFQIARSQRRYPTEASFRITDPKRSSNRSTATQP